VSENELTQLFKALELKSLKPQYWKDYENSNLPTLVSLLTNIAKHVCTHGTEVADASMLPDMDKIYDDLNRIAKMFGFKGVER